MKLLPLLKEIIKKNMPIIRAKDDIYISEDTDAQSWIFQDFISYTEAKFGDYSLEFMKKIIDKDEEFEMKIDEEDEYTFEGKWVSTDFGISFPYSWNNVEGSLKFPSLLDQGMDLELLDYFDIVS